MSINNSPVLNTNCGLSEFRFWCQKVLPLVYDDSLSYYETLCKIANKLNEAITSANTSQENIVLLKQAYDELLEYINDYTKTLDKTVVNSVNEKINNMAESGELFDYVVSRITAADVGAVPAGYVSEKLSFTDYASALAHIKTVYASMNNNEKKCLFVDISDGNVYDGEFPSGAYFVEIYRELDNYGIVEFINSAYVKIIVRIDGTWGNFCYENPPMSMGVEYRTAERWNGNVVYVKLVNCGTVTNDATVTLEGVTACVRFIGYLSYPSETAPRKPLPIWSGSTIGTGYHAEITQPASPYGINQFIIKTDSNADSFGSGGYTWFVQAWYTKD